MTIAPNISIRRFQVFAEFVRIQKLSEGAPPDEAKGYALWNAKVVASHLWSERAQLKDHQWGRNGAEKWLMHKDIPQTDVMFDREIIERMGRAFYEGQFSPAIQDAFSRGESYESIRDPIREKWQITGPQRSRETTG